MKRWIMVVLVSAAAWQAYGRYASSLPTNPHAGLATEAGRTQPVASSSAQQSASAIPNFACDGRTHCSQMTSYEEASFFLSHCPGVKMDGDHDGIPCEQQWASPEMSSSDADESGTHSRRGRR